MNRTPALAENIRFMSKTSFRVVLFSVAPSSGKYITVDFISIFNADMSELCRCCGAAARLPDVRSAPPLVKLSGNWNVVVSGSDANQVTVGQSEASDLISCRECNCGRIASSESPLESRLLLFARFSKEERSLFNLQ